MSFTSIMFLPFVFVAALLYFTVFRKCQWVWLLIASLVFYLLSGPKYIVFILVTSFSTYLIARRIYKIRCQETEATSDKSIEREERKKISKKFTARCKGWLALDLILNFGILAVIKYTDFALSGVSHILSVFGVDWAAKTFSFVLPLGISFYTFMTVGYVLDVYWRRYEAEKNPLKLLLFASYFPHIIQGPIGRYNKLKVQFEERHYFDYDRVKKGIQLVLWGYFEKMVIADRLAIFANGVYARWEETSGIPLIIAIIFFSLQLYLDFQGCMDIARGVSQIFGIELEKNFWHPYFSKTMPEFWKRWHITLGNWFKDYLLYPVSMSRLCKSIDKFTRKKWGKNVSHAIATIIPSACVWVITGIWHGAASRYLLWGIYHGILIIGGACLDIPFQKLGKVLRVNTEAWSFDLWRMIRTFILSAIGRIFFVSNGFHEAIAIMKKTFDVTHLRLYTLWDKSLYNYGLNQRGFILCIVLILLIWFVSMKQEKGMVIRDEIAKQNIVFRWALTLLLIIGIIALGIYGEGYNASAFVYGQF